MATRFGLFPLNTVVFPGSRTPLHVFEDRYRALVRDLLAIEDPAWTAARIRTMPLSDESVDLPRSAS